MKAVTRFLKFLLVCAGVITLSTAKGRAQQSGVSLPGQINTSNYNNTRLSHLIFKNFLDQKEKAANPIKFEDIQGSPYEPEEFVPGTFYMKDNPPLTLRMRHNMYDDEIEVMEDNGKITAFLKNESTQFRLNNTLIRPYQYMDDGLDKKSNFHVLVDGDIKFMLRKKVVLIPQAKAPTPNQQDRAAKFVTHNDYFLLRKDGSPVPFKEKKKDILKLFPDKSGQIKKYIKANNLNVRRQEDLIRLFEHLNS
jgi:hypothetical protein